MLLNVIDNSNWKQSEELPAYDSHKLAAVERDSTLSELAVMLAHELNQPLAIIANYIHGCIRRIEGNNFQIQEIIHAMKQIAEQSNRANEIIQRMKNYCTNKPLNFEMTCLNTLIQETVHLIKQEIGSDFMDLFFRSARYLPTMQLDKIHLQQAILNILRYSISAMKMVNTENPRIMLETNPLDCNAVEVLIQDNGPIIPEEKIQLLFNSYLPPQPGDMSLAVSHTLIQSHGGQLSITRGPLQGNCFRFSLSFKIFSPTPAHLDNSTVE